MSQANVELVRRGTETADAFWEMLDEHVTMDTRDHPAMSVDVGEVCVGREAVISATRRYWGAWADYHFDVEELFDAGASVVCFVRERGRGRGSGVPVETQSAQVWTFRRGRVVRWELFEDRTAALEAVELVE